MLLEKVEGSLKGPEGKRSGQAKYRDRLKIIEDILTAALNGASKTQLVYRANLNFKRLRSYLPDLAERGLIAAAEGSPARYTTTEKGRAFLSHCEKARELL